MDNFQAPRLYYALMVRMVTVCATLVVPTIMLLVMLYWTGHMGGVAWLSSGRDSGAPEAIEFTVRSAEACLSRRFFGVEDCSGFSREDVHTLYVAPDESLGERVQVGPRSLDTEGLQQLWKSGVSVSGYALHSDWLAVVVYDPRFGLFVADASDVLLDRLHAMTAAEAELRTADNQFLRGTWRGADNERLVVNEISRSVDTRTTSFDAPYAGYPSAEYSSPFVGGASTLTSFYAEVPMRSLEGFEQARIIISVPTDVMLYYVNITIVAFISLTLALVLAMAVLLRQVARKHLVPLEALAARVDVLGQGRLVGSGDFKPVAGRSYEFGRLEGAIDRLEVQWQENDRLAQQLADEQAAVQRATLESLGEKETLLKEIHHRVKNNLQIISSLLMLQSREIEDEAARSLLGESVSRVRSMALVHQQLYGIESLAHIDLGVYVKELVEALRNALAPQARVDIRVTAGTIDIDQAIPIALILNELMTNALKYGLDDDTSPDEADVIVELTENDGKVRLSVTNFGHPLPDDFDPKQRRGLGLKLINSLVRQIRGEFALIKEGRTEFSVSFRPERRARQQPS